MSRCGLPFPSCSPLLPPLSVLGTRGWDCGDSMCNLGIGEKPLACKYFAAGLARTACDLPPGPPTGLPQAPTGDAVPAEFLELSGISSLALTLAVPSTSSLWGQLVSSQGHFSTLHAYLNLWPFGGSIGVISDCGSCSQALAWTPFCGVHFRLA